MQKILLTGCNGLLGQKIVELLAERPNVQLIATGRGINRNALREGYTYEDVDLLDEERVRDVFEVYQPSAVIHTAAATQVDWCEDHRDECDAINIGATALLAELCETYESHLVFISTDFIFDGTAGPYKENAEANPPNYYGMSKWKAEQVVQESGAKYAILRTVLLYGITPEMSRSNIVLWVKKSLEEGKEIRIVDDQVRTPTLAEDLAYASVAAVMKDARGIYHISGIEQMNIFEIAEAVADFWGLDKSLMSRTDSASLNQKAKRPPVTGFITLKAQIDLAYKPHSFVQGLALIDRQMKDDVF